MAAIDALFEELITRGGTDLHLAVNQPPLVRVRGDLLTLRDAVLSAKELEEMLLELVTTAQRTRLASELDLEIAYAFRDVARFRGSLYVKHSGIAASFRLVPARVPSLAELGCPEVLVRLADQRAGLVVVASPAANGKSTTTAAIVDQINKARACHVLTIECPIEFVHEPVRAQITQREVGTHLPSVAVGLRNASRENADVVVSELATHEEIDLALRLSEGGALVLANVAASGSAAAIERLVATFEPEHASRARARLADVVAGIVVQHLVRAADSNTRLAVHEIAVRTPAVVAAIREGRPQDLADAVKAGSAAGMQLLDAGLDRLVAGKRISAETAFDCSVDKARFAAR